MAPTPWSAGILTPRLLRNKIWLRYCKWADDIEDRLATQAAKDLLQGKRPRVVQRPSVRPFIRTDRDTWLNSECTGYLCSCILPSCRLPPSKGGHDYILGKRSTRFVRWALRWRRGVFAVNVTCAKCRMPFRTSHVGHLIYSQIPSYLR